MTFDFVPPAEFYRILEQDQEFCSALGSAVLAAGKLESSLREYFLRRGLPDPGGTATLGHLAKKLDEAGLLSTNGREILAVLKTQRNYLAHNLFALFQGRINQTILTVDELIEMDTAYFVEIATQLEEDLNGIAKLVERADERAPQLW